MVTLTGIKEFPKEWQNDCRHKCPFWVKANFYACGPDYCGVKAAIATYNVMHNLPYKDEPEGCPFQNIPDARP